MANKEHLKILKQGAYDWNQWRKENPEIQPDLSGVDLREVDLMGADLSEANLKGAKLSTCLDKINLYKACLEEADLSNALLNEACLIGTNLKKANLSRANLCDAFLKEANLTGANLCGANLNNAELIEANLTEANLSKEGLYFDEVIRTDLTCANLSCAKLIKANLESADLTGANFSKANLSNANLSYALLIETNFEKATITNCKVYGIAAWDIKGKPLEQSNLIITPSGEPTITVDNLEVAQFIYLLLNNEKIRHVIDTITSKVVLILGRFTSERKAVLDAIKGELRKRDYLPVLFDFKKPINRSFRETVLTLAHLARFVIADFTSAKIVLDEVPHIVEKVAVPVQPLLKGSGKEPVTLPDLRINHRSLLDTYRYKNTDDLLVSLEEKVIIPAEAKVRELNKARAKELLKSKNV